MFCLPLIYLQKLQFFIKNTKNIIFFFTLKNGIGLK